MDQKLPSATGDVEEGDADVHIRPVRIVANNEAESDLRTITARRTSPFCFQALECAMDHVAPKLAAITSREQGLNIFVAFSGMPEYFIETHRFE